MLSVRCTRLVYAQHGRERMGGESPWGRTSHPNARKSEELRDGQPLAEGEGGSARRGLLAQPAEGLGSQRQTCEPM
jgi:hypothetical protein